MSSVAILPSNPHPAARGEYGAHSTIMVGTDTGLIKRLQLTKKEVESWGEQRHHEGVVDMRMIANDQILSTFQDGTVRLLRIADSGDSQSTILYNRNLDLSKPINPLRPIAIPKKGSTFAEFQEQDHSPFCGLAVAKPSLSSSSTSLDNPMDGLRVFYATRCGGLYVDNAVIIRVPLLQSKAVTTSQELTCARGSPDGTLSRVATIGRRIEVTVWDVESGKASWQSKRPPNDFLDLAQYNHYKDFAWYQQDPNTPIAVTQDCVIKLFDCRAKERRPVQEAKPTVGTPFTTIHCPVEGHRFYTGDSTGNVFQWDMRHSGKQMGKYKGISGSVRSIDTHPSGRFVVTAGLDRHVRIHETESRFLVSKFYMKQKLNAVIWPLILNPPAQEQPEQEQPEQQESVEEEEDQDVEDELWADLPQVVPKTSRKSQGNNLNQKHRKKSRTK
ncbi:MAG: hypothetical protein Q8P67_13390 [archaeon]|nr:hypothetical protein [archaeon]